ncbi:hypothetical protein N7481_000430 [Penicillium waksmanii]|uniref:uncharacterized protein n=1 Tax=Penicillium waksmanii TaxID=69791 RepID=UPI0025488A66|nr:uncharacterized protein N7481_000430 [Penicillium waksmanii]KAJ6000021.1 hypothetical protein N7481_000430 [Penicillium waksmanii]
MIGFPQAGSSVRISSRSFVRGQEGNSRNAFLVKCKRRGLSYKEIKRIGGFKEAESTRRGGI